MDSLVWLSCLDIFDPYDFISLSNREVGEKLGGLNSQLGIENPIHKSYQVPKLSRSRLSRVDKMTASSTHPHNSTGLWKPRPVHLAVDHPTLRGPTNLNVYGHRGLNLGCERRMLGYPYTYSFLDINPPTFRERILGIVDHD
jgi:hypothetical protein